MQISHGEGKTQRGGAGGGEAGRLCRLRLWQVQRFPARSVHTHAPALVYVGGGVGGGTRRGLEEGEEMWRGKKGWREEDGGRSDRCRWEERGEQSFTKYDDSPCC